MIGKCEHCAAEFQFQIFHCGFGECSYAYCERCGRTAVLSGWSKRWPNGVKCTQAEIAPEMEAHLSPCECGGRFRKGQAPRCPKCRNTLSADGAAEYIEAQAPGAKKGWRWQKSWHALYCMAIENWWVKDNFV
jgi:hypothetical protein